MPHDPRAYLVDVRTAVTAIAAFMGGRDLNEFRSNALVRSAIERQLEIIGEALNQLSRVDPELAERVPDVTILARKLPPTKVITPRP